MKRLILVLLSALGLVAFAAVPAFADSPTNVPVTAAVSTVCGWQTLPTGLTFASFQCGH